MGHTRDVFDRAKTASSLWFNDMLARVESFRWVPGLSLWCTWSTCRRVTHDSRCTVPRNARSTSDYAAAKQMEDGESPVAEGQGGGEGGDVVSPLSNLTQDSMGPEDPEAKESKESKERPSVDTKLEGQGMEETKEGQGAAGTTTSAAAKPARSSSTAYTVALRGVLPRLTQVLDALQATAAKK